MAISTGLIGNAMGYYDPDQDRYSRQQKEEFMRMMQAQQMNSWQGLHGVQQTPQAQQAKPITNPEPNPVLLLLE